MFLLSMNYLLFITKPGFAMQWNWHQKPECTYTSLFEVEMCTANLKICEVKKIHIKYADFLLLCCTTQMSKDKYQINSVLMESLKEMNNSMKLRWGKFATCQNVENIKPQKRQLNLQLIQEGSTRLSAEDNQYCRNLCQRHGLLEIELEVQIRFKEFNLTG